jgi:hypothetical protein
MEERLCIHEDQDVTMRKTNNDMVMITGRKLGRGKTRLLQDNPIRLDVFLVHPKLFPLFFPVTPAERAIVGAGGWRS